MDARLDVLAVLGLRVGDAHVIRNAGGLVTDDVIRSLAISQRYLETREVVVVQHTDCGMLKISEEDVRAELARDAGFRPSWAVGAFDDLDTSVRESVARIQASPFLAHRDAVTGHVYDVDIGELRDVRPR